MLLASGMSSKERLWRFYERLTGDRIVAIAAGVTFYALLAIFPAIAALVAIYGLFADPAAIAKHLDDISNFIPAGAIEVIRDQLARVTSGGRGTLGFAFVIGLGISLWSANAGVKALIDALNIAYGEREKRGFFRLNAVSLAFTLGGILTVMIALGVIVVLPLALHYVGLEGAPRSIVVLAKWPLMFVAVALGIAVLCHYGPSRTEPELLRGRTRRNTTVNFRGSATAGDLVPVTIESATSTTLAGSQLALAVA